MRIGIMTGGGDCSGLNAVIRAVAKTLMLQHGAEIIGFEYSGVEIRNAVTTHDLAPGFRSQLMPMITIYGLPDMKFGGLSIQDETVKIEEKSFDFHIGGDSIRKRKGR